MYIMLLAGAGNETTTRLIGWTGKLLSEHPDQRRELAADRSLVPGAIEEILRYEAPSPVQARTVQRAQRRVLRPDAPCRRDHGAHQRLREPRRPPLPRCRPLRHPPEHRPPPELRLRAALLPRRRRACLEGRVALDEVLQRWNDWDVDWDNAKQAHTPNVRGWERLPVQAVANFLKKKKGPPTVAGEHRTRAR